MISQESYSVYHFTTQAGKCPCFSKKTLLSSHFRSGQSPTASLIHEPTDTSTSGVNLCLHYLHRLLCTLVHRKQLEKKICCILDFVFCGNKL